MSHSNGIISAPVSIEDVRLVIGESSNDLATLCLSENINPLSIYKPTRTAGLFPTDVYLGKAKGGSEDNDWFLGVNCFGFKKPACTISSGTLSNGVHVPGVYSYGGFSIATDKWTYHRPSGYYRLLDFNHYCHNTQVYKQLNGTKPFYVTSALVMEGTSSIVASIQITGQKEDALSPNDEDGLAGSLGIGKLFNTENSGDVYLGLAVVPTDVSRSIAAIYLSTTSIGSISSTTGLNFVWNIGCTFSSCVEGSKLSPVSGKFYSEETVYVVPFLYKETGNGTGVYCCFLLNTDWTTATKQYTLGEITSFNPAAIKSVTATLSATKTSDGYYLFYFGSYTGLQWTVTVNGGNLYTKHISILPGDGNTTVMAVNYGSLGNANCDEASGYHKTEGVSASTTYNLYNTDWSANNPQAKPMLKVKSSSTTISICVAMEYLSKSNGMVTVYKKLSLDCSNVKNGSVTTFSFGTFS